jgi:hypothetical protein
MEKKIVQEKEKWEGRNETLSHRERESHPHTLMACISVPAGVGNETTTPNSKSFRVSHKSAGKPPSSR